MRRALPLCVQRPRHVQQLQAGIQRSQLRNPLVVLKRFLSAESFPVVNPCLATPGICVSGTCVNDAPGKFICSTPSSSLGLIVGASAGGAAAAIVVVVLVVVLLYRRRRSHVQPETASHKSAAAASVGSSGIQRSRESFSNQITTRGVFVPQLDPMYGDSQPYEPATSDSDAHYNVAMKETRMDIVANVTYGTATGQRAEEDGDYLHIMPGTVAGHANPTFESTDDDDHVGHLVEAVREFEHTDASSDYPDADVAYEPADASYEPADASFEPADASFEAQEEPVGGDDDE